MNDKRAAYIFSLQLSHVPMNVETWSDTESGARLADTSIEPRSYERGNPALRVFKQWAQKALQLSHVPMNVETGRLRPLLPAPVVRTSIEPRSYERGNLSVARVDEMIARLTSIEPRSYERGNPRATCRNWRARKGLQLSHVPMNVETLWYDIINYETSTDFN